MFSQANQFIVSYAKQGFLDNQEAQMIARYKNADQNERAAIIIQVDSFLLITKGDEKSFWLKLRQNLEILNENNAKYKYLVGI